MTSWIRPWSLPVAMLVVALAASGDGRAECPPAAPTGYFEGTAKSKQAGELDVSLNLRQVKGDYEGELSTPVGAFALKGGSFAE